MRKGVINVYNLIMINIIKKIDLIILLYRYNNI